MVHSCGVCLGWEDDEILDLRWRLPVYCEEEKEEGGKEMVSSMSFLELHLLLFVSFLRRK